MSHCDTNARTQQKDDEQSEAWSRFRSLDWPRTDSSSTADDIRTTPCGQGRLRRGSYLCQSLRVKDWWRSDTVGELSAQQHVSLSCRGGVAVDANLSTEPHGDGAADATGRVSAVRIRLSAPIILLIRYLLRNLMESDQHCLAQFSWHRFSLLVY